WPCTPNENGNSNRQLGSDEQLQIAIRNSKITMSDLRFAFRQLWKSPGFAVVAIATLALGIGANTAIFSVIESALLRPLPFPNAERLVRVYETFDENGARSNTLNLAEKTVQQWREY